MAVTETIQELLQGIDDAQYGRDMRQYIHKGIQKCYEEGSAGETDLVARTEIDNVRDEIQGLLGNFATVEPLSTATKAYKVGDKLVYNNTMYRVTSAISIGGMIIPGTNAVATTLEAELYRFGQVMEYSAYSTAITPPVSDAVLVETDTLPVGTYLIFAYAEAASTLSSVNFGMKVGRGSNSGTFTMFMLSERGTGNSKAYTMSGFAKLSAADTIQLRVSNGSVNTTYNGVMQLIRISDSLVAGW